MWGNYLVHFAVMQPYLFPYLGYFQLVAAVDMFVFLDDVAYIKRGWIDRNRVMLDGNEHRFSVQVRDKSQNRRIMDHELVAPGNREAILSTVLQAYCRAPHYAEVAPVLEAVFLSEVRYIADLAQLSVTAVSGFLELETQFLRASVGFPGTGLSGEERIVEICTLGGASCYVNMIAGRHLYSQERFRQSGIDLYFLEPAMRPYPQLSASFIPGLSIIDLLMNLGRKGTHLRLKEFSLRDG